MEKETEFPKKFDKLIEEAKSRGDLEFETDLITKTLNLFNRIDTQVFVILEKAGKMVAVFGNGVTPAALECTITDLFLKYPDLEIKVMRQVFHHRAKGTNPDEETATIH